MIIDCYTFYNEMELLQIRLEELKNVVDWFVLVEAEETFSGKPKHCVFEQNQSHFSQYNICHVKLPVFPSSASSRWQREGYFRDAAASGLKSLQPAPAMW